MLGAPPRRVATAGATRYVSMRVERLAIWRWYEMIVLREIAAIRCRERS
jgi:hypothetical protein